MDDERERRLRALRIERREHQAELEAVLAEVDAGARTVADVLRDHGERGDRIRLEAGPHTITGLVHHLGDEVVTLVSDTGRSWDVAIGGVSLVGLVQRGAAAYPLGGGHPRTLLARARQLVARRAMIEVGRLDRPDVIRGRVLAVSPEVLELDRGSSPSVVLAWSAVVWLSEG